MIVTSAFFIVGPTASGKSEIAAEVARACDGEVVSADAFQIYAGLDWLTAKPDRVTLHKVPHHLIGAVPLGDQMNAERFRALAAQAIRSVQHRGKRAFIVGGSGMYVKALTHGLSPLPAADPKLREQLTRQSVDELLGRLSGLDPETARAIDGRNKHRVLRALEICLLTARPASELRRGESPAEEPAGILLVRDRDELYRRINHRVEMMFANGVVEEVRSVAEVSITSEKTLGFRQIRELIAGQISEAECIAQIQQATRRYAKRQLTWFQRRSNFEPLNLSRYGHSEAIELIARKARLCFAQKDD